MNRQNIILNRAFKLVNRSKINCSDLDTCTVSRIRVQLSKLGDIVMSVRERIKKYKAVGGASDLVRVEVLVPKASRDVIITAAKECRTAHRAEKKKLLDSISVATERYGLRILDNIDLEKLDELPQKARIVANALMERGDGRAYAMGRKILDQLGNET